MANSSRYDNPPIVEVAASAQFDSIGGMQGAHLGLIWQSFRSRFPGLEQHPPIQSAIERRRPQVITSGTVTLGMMETPRAWFVSEDSGQLIQVQQNKFVRNWRKHQTPDREYPHYEPHIRPSFLKDFRLFREAVRDLGFGDIVVNQCELTYFNRILPNALWSNHGDIGNFLTFWNSNPEWIGTFDLDSAAVKASSEILSLSGEFLGRLHFELTPSFHAPSESPGEPVPIFACNLVARGRPETQSEEGIMQFFDLGRSRINLLFEKIFSPEIKKLWGKKGER